MKNYYEILEVNKKASKEVIEKAYKVLIKKYHPDLYKGEKQQYAEKKTKEITEAYRILSDEFLREQYNNELEEQEEIYKQRFDNLQKQEENKQDKKKKQKQYDEQTFEQRVNEQGMGTLGGIIELTKQLINDIRKSKERREEFKENTQKNIIAIILTVIIIITIGVILWYIPFTNGWMRELLFENPLFNWIGNLFSH